MAIKDRLWLTESGGTLSMEIEWYTILEIDRYTMQEIGWYTF